jgi:tetratricopeptide (TPR) repeat protein
MEEIGEGGMGLVFVAEQQEPIRRKVALKVLKPGMDSRQVVARFEAERQALALMDHPNIAQVHDGGSTPSGRPYFVMELVKGVPITAFCDQNQLSVRERLELFVSVCAAVQHAHQKGIIHRDIKPSNVLVASHDGVPVVKVIDFGVAKAIGQQLTDKTIYTQMAQMVGTPLYMSPEQAGQSSLDVDTRSDIYSLGVLLYELLTGTTPFDKERLHKAGYDELRRIIREEEPPKPSTRISTLGAAATSTSTQRKSDPKRLSQLCRGELDWIVMKCLEKDRNRRYETANGLAMDLQRYLHDEPVLACPPSAWYRLKKLARRNKAALITAAVLAGILLLGTVVSIWQAFRATDAEGLATTRLAAETRAKAEAFASALEAKKQGKLAGKNAEATKRALAEAKANLKRADQNLTLALEALDNVYMKDVEDRIIRHRQRAKPERESLERGLKFYEQFAQQNSGHPELEAVRAKAYRRAGSLRLELGDFKEAEAQLTKAIPVFKKLADQPATTADFRQELARCFNLLSETRVRARMNRKAEATCRQAVVVWQKLVDDFPKEPGHRVGHAASLMQLGQVLAMLNGPGEREEAEKLMRRTLELYKALATEYPGNVGYRGELAWTYHQLNHYVVRHSGRRREAVENQQQAVAILRKRAADSPNNIEYRQALGDQYHELGDRLNEAGQVVQAEEAYNQGLRIYEKLLAESPNADNQLRVALSHVFLGNFFQGTKRLKRAEEAYRKALAAHTKLIADPTTHLSVSVMWRLPVLAQDLADLLRRTGRTVEADAIMRKAADNCLVALRPYDQWPADRSLPGDAWEFTSSYRNLGQLLKEVGRFPEAAAAYQQALRVCERAYPDSHSADLWQWRVRVHVELGRALAAAGKRAESESAFRKAAEVVQQQETEFRGKGEYRRQLAEGQASAAQDFYSAGRYSEAEKYMRRAIPLREELAAEFPRDFDRRYEVADAYYWLYSPLSDSRRLGAAEEVNRKALDLFAKLAKDFPDVPKCLEGVAGCHLRSAWILAGTDRLLEAETAVRRGLSIRQKLAAAFPENNSYCWHLADAYDWLAEILKRRGKRAQAIDALRQSVPYYDKEMAALNNPATRRFLADRLDQLGEMLADTNRVKEAEESYRKALPIWQGLVAEFKLRDDHLNLATNLSRLGRLLNNAGRLDDAVTAYREAIAFYDKLAARFPSDPAHRAQQSESLLNLGHLLRKSNRPQDAEQAYRHSLDAGEKVAKLSPAELWHAHMPAACYYHLGDLMLETKKYKEAAGFYRQAMPLYQKLLERFPQPSYLQGERTHIVQALATALQKTGRSEEAMELMRDLLQRGSVTAQSLNLLAWQLATAADPNQRDPAWAVKLAKLAVEREPDNGVFANTLGTAQYRVGDWKAALESLKTANELNQGAYFAHDGFFLAMACWKLADKDRAGKWYTAAERWTAKNAPKVKELLGFRAEAAALLGLSQRGGAPPATKQQDDRELYALIIEANPQAAWAHVARGQIHQDNGKLEMAQEDYRKAIELYTNLQKQKPNSPRCWSGRASAYAEQGDWAKATSDWQKAAALWDKKAATRAGPLVWYQLALARLGAKDQAGYRSACGEILKRFAGKDHLPYSDFALWGCAVARSGVDDHAPLVAWAEKRAGSDVIYRVAFGAVLYRAGRLEEALQHLNEAETVLARKSNRRTTIAYPRYFLAMVHHRLGHVKEARQWLEKANREAEQGRKNAAGTAWNRRLTLELLRREADTLLNARTKE